MDHEQDIRSKAHRDFSDTRFNWIRTPSRRKALVMTTFLFVGLYGASNYLDWPLIALPALIAFGACYWLLRVSVRGVTDYPDEVVDERMREARGYTYRYAFIGTTGLTSLYLIAYIVNQLLAKAEFVLPMSADQLHDLAFVLLFSSIALPSAIHAWLEPEEL